MSKEANPSPMQWKPPKLSKDFNELFSDRFIWASEWIPTNNVVNPPTARQSIRKEEKVPVPLPDTISFENATESDGDGILPTSTADGFSGLYCLSHLEQLALVEVDWGIHKYDEWSEKISLSLRVVPRSALNGALTFERRRSKNGPQKRKRTKQILAATALNTIFHGGAQWSEMTYHHFKEFAAGRLSKVRDDYSIETDVLSSRAMKTIDGADAITCLKQLEDVGLLLSIDFKIVKGPDEKETMALCIRRNGDDELVSQEKRLVSGQSRKSIRQGLAARAMKIIAGDRWFDHSFEALKSKLESEERLTSFGGVNATRPGVA